MTRIILWSLLTLAAANWVLFTLGLVVGIVSLRCLGLAVAGSLAAFDWERHTEPEFWAQYPQFRMEYELRVAQSDMEQPEPDHR